MMLVELAGGVNEQPHCGLSSRAPPSDARAPPVAPPIRELTYVSDPAFVDDAAPPEPVRSTD
jgi:hypothetical protein